MSMDYDIRVGDTFFRNNFSTRYGHALPDFLIVTDIQKNIVTTKYENHYVYTKERTFDIANLWVDSNLNKDAKEPTWIFLNNRR